MSYLGKEYKFEKDENFEAYLTALGLPAEQIARITQYKPSIKLDKDGDTYTYSNITPTDTKKVTFTPGVEFEDEIRPGIKVKTVYTIDGNTVTQQATIQGNKTSIFKREYSGDKLKLTITCNVWDGVCYRYYSV